MCIAIPFAADGAIESERGREKERDRGRSGWHPCFIGIVSIPISCGGQPRLFLSFSSSLSHPIAPSTANGMAMHISFEGEVAILSCLGYINWKRQRMRERQR
jgi:hypothetical protein